MNKDYKIFNDGTIFEIREDGSISKIARIDDKGNITGLSGSVNRQQGGKGKYWFFIIFLLATIAILGVLYLRISDNLDYYIGRYYDVDKELSEANSLINDVSEAYPMIITDIEIGNTSKGGDVQTGYGERIYDYNTMYLKPRISYVGLKSGTKTLKVKWYTPSGSISRGDSSPAGFSQSDDEYISGGDDVLFLSGWGNEYKGNWSSGTYRIEIWYENTCLKAKTFKIY